MVVKIIHIKPYEANIGQQGPMMDATKDAGNVEWRSRLKALVGACQS